MKPVTFDKACYRVDGEPFYLNSGEFHYFRVPKEEWRRRMRLFREAGGNCLATYIPWLIHEPCEGQFVFGGADGTHDLERLLETAAQEGLYVIARPGPYQYSELICDGLPRWLCERYPRLRAQDINGKSFRSSTISYVHPLFLEKVHRWFGQVCPIIARHTVSRGGPVAYTQIDNELIGIQIWYGSLDYNVESMGFGRSDGRYARFLRRRYNDVENLDAAWGTNCGSFEEARPIAAPDAPTPADVRRARDYWEFYLETVREYATTLAGWMRQSGIDTPLVHNAAGPSMNANFQEMAEAMGKDFLLGSDHYYTLNQTWPQNNPTPQYIIECFCSLESLRLMGYPPTVFELQGGSAADWPPMTAVDGKACYFAHAALGMKGSNYYIFTGGPNVPGTGATSDLYDYGAAVGAADGEIRPLYYAQQEFGRFWLERPWLSEAHRECDFRLAVDLESRRSHMYCRGRAGLSMSRSEGWEFAKRGLLSSAMCANLSPELCDLRQEDWITDRSTPLVVLSTASMSADQQDRVVRFLQGGGKAIICPLLPTVDLDFNPCTILADFLGSPTIAGVQRGAVRLTIGEAVNVQNNGDVFITSSLPAGAEVVGIEEFSGAAVAWRLQTPGGGKAIFLGLRWIHAMREHEQMLANLLGQLGLRRKVTCSNPNVWTSLRTFGDRSMLFVMNLLTSPMEAVIACRPEWSSGVIETGKHRLEGLSVKTVELHL